MLSPWTRNAEDFSKFQRQEKMSFMKDKRGETHVSIFRFRSDLLEKIIPKKLKGDARKGAKGTLLKDLKSTCSRYLDCTHNHPTFLLKLIFQLFKPAI